jgi:hypothetical protein
MIATEALVPTAAASHDTPPCFTWAAVNAMPFAPAASSGVTPFGPSIDMPGISAIFAESPLARAGRVVSVFASLLAQAAEIASNARHESVRIE